MNAESAGKWVFLVSIVIAVITGAVAAIDYSVVAVLAVLGLIVGLLNVTEKEATAFLVSTIALALLTLSLGSLLEGVSALKAIITNIGTVAGAAGLVVALKSIWSLSSSK
ncbi:MAG: hypothetical protein HYT73_03585 [Candidatus Aenigmarchaeota archaeon]|nr:hypothetical protein [Candidatus Aenigmarchaeota archaeon]